MTQLKPQNELALIVAYYLSRLDREGYSSLGYASFNEAANKIGEILDVKPNTIKNMRDEFDPHHQNNRTGWLRELRASRLEVVKTFQATDDGALLQIVKEILENKKFQPTDGYDNLLNKPNKHESNVKAGLSMNLASMKNRQFYKFTGPPENWVTAIRYMTWGLEEKYRDRWTKILPGDIFVMHSTSTNTKVKGAISAIIGFGVVADNPAIKNTPLWLEEIQDSANRWPLLVPFSEIYLFSPYFEKNAIPTPTLDNIFETVNVSHEILENSIPLSRIHGFPQMGSFSSVKAEVISQIFDDISRMYVIGQQSTPKSYMSTPFIKLNDVEDQNRYGTSLQLLDSVRTKTFTAKGSSYSKDPALLERAEYAHQVTVEKLMNLFKSLNYETYFNKHVDLFATNGDKSFLFEVKSNENRNFLPQARKGIVQLFEYEHFEIKKFHAENKIQAKMFKNLTFSREPTNKSYTEFMNTLDLGVSYFDKNKLKAFGKSIGISEL